MKIRTIDRTWLSRFPGAEDWRKVLPVRGGLSTDEKFEIFTRTGEHLILRVADESQTRRKYAEFAFMQRCQALGFPMPRPVACGLHAGRVYELLTFVPGEPLSQELIGMP